MTDENSAELKQWQRDHPDWFVAGTWTAGTARGRGREPSLDGRGFDRVAWPFDRRDNLPLGGSTGSPYYGGGGLGGFSFGLGRSGSVAPRGTSRQSGPASERGGPTSRNGDRPGGLGPEPNPRLRQELERAGRLEPGDGNEGHHMVPKGGPGMTGARDPTAAQGLLAEAEVLLDSAENGVVLSRSFHRRLHTKEYYQFVTESLRREQATGGTQPFLRRLQRLLKAADKSFQETGEMPIWKMQ